VCGVVISQYGAMISISLCCSGVDTARITFGRCSYGLTEMLCFRLSVSGYPLRSFSMLCQQIVYIRRLPDMIAQAEMLRTVDEIDALIDYLHAHAGCAGLPRVG